jgi:hypothetical protein
VLSVFKLKHRLSETLGPADLDSENSNRGRHLLSKALVLFSAVAWLALVIFIFAAPPHRFSQPNCDQFQGDILLTKFYAAGGYFLIKLAKTSVSVGVVFLLPIILTVLSWWVVIIVRRRDIWKDGYSFRFWIVW